MDSARRKLIHDAMVRLADGDRMAFDVVLDQLWPVILSFAQRGSAQSADAEDIAQEVFFKICSRIADFDRARDGVSWAFGIASYELMTHRRRGQRRRETHDSALLAGVPDARATQEEAALQAEIALAYERAVDTLTDDDRSVLGWHCQVTRKVTLLDREQEDRQLPLASAIHRRTGRDKLACRWCYQLDERAPRQRRERIG